MLMSKDPRPLLPALNFFQKYIEESRSGRRPKKRSIENETRSLLFFFSHRRKAIPRCKGGLREKGEEAGILPSSFSLSLPFSPSQRAVSRYLPADRGGKNTHFYTVKMCYLARAARDSGHPPLLLPSTFALIPSPSPFLRLARAHVHTYAHVLRSPRAPIHAHGGGINSLAQISTPGAGLRFQASAPTPSRPTFILSAACLGAEKRGMGTRHAARTILFPRRHLPSRTTRRWSRKIDA